PFHAQCTAANFEHCGFRASVLVADAARPAARADVLVLDPDRRPAGRRTLDPERWSPPLSRALDLARSVRRATLKLAPALDVTRVALGRGRWRWRWVSAERELVEVSLLAGELARAEAGGDVPREVVALAGGAEVRFEARPETVEPWP